MLYLEFMYIYNQTLLLSLVDVTCQSLAVSLFFPPDLNKRRQMTAKQCTTNQYQII